ncbi:MAG: hypothetical protein DMG96_42610 [Acidobacteria bacterium]|nr:MAG: hypothetical protein DMG96_42610 [Acidobacteriota bacterium]
MHKSEAWQEEKTSLSENLFLHVDFCRTTSHTPIVVPQKPTRPTHSAKNVQGDFGKFTNFMKRLVAVPHSEIKAKLDAEKRAKVRKSKRTSASRASNAKD